jgi:poly-beta-hydroxyalkanoate depolymerase
MDDIIDMLKALDVPIEDDSIDDSDYIDYLIDVDKWLLEV